MNFLMRLKIKDPGKPKATKDVIADSEDYWEVTLPDDYRSFLLKNNGGIPNKESFEYNGHQYAIQRFLSLFEDPEDNEKYGYYDINVVASDIEERLTDNEDLTGLELVPIAATVFGDYVCLDFRNGAKIPAVCLWSSDESGELDPVTYQLADNFTEFLNKLYHVG